MTASASTRGGRDGTVVDSWPWECLDCGTTIYHDGEFCRECAAAYRVRARARRDEAPDGFLDWMRRESVSDYVLKVTAIAGVELALTAVWLQLLLGGTAVLDLLVPVLA